ncbi:MAG: hypothetical protein AAFQ65_14970 [Myxococcota bacterium]
MNVSSARSRVQTETDSSALAGIQRTIARLQQRLAALEPPDRGAFLRRETRWENGRRVVRSVFDRDAFGQAMARYHSTQQGLSRQLEAKRAELNAAKQRAKDNDGPVRSSDTPTKPQTMLSPRPSTRVMDLRDVDQADASAWVRSTSITRSSSTAELEPWDEHDADRCYAEDPEVIAAAWDEDPETESQEGVGSFLEGALVGGFSDNQSWSAVAGQTVMGFVPIAGQIADARDIIAAGKDVIDGEEGAWGTLGISTAAIIPGLDFLKGGTRIGRNALRQAASDVDTDPLVQASLKELTGPFHKKQVDAVKRQLKTLNQRRVDMIDRLDGLHRELKAELKDRFELLEDAMREDIQKRIDAIDGELPPLLENELLGLRGLPNDPVEPYGGLAELVHASRWFREVTSARNALDDHLKPSDLIGAFRDHAGLPIRTSGDGKAHRHDLEVEYGLNSLRGLRDNFNRRLRQIQGPRGRAGDPQARLSKEYLEPVTTLIDRTERFLERARGD